MMETIISVKGLSYWFEDRTPGLDNISLSITRGEFVLLAGRNGSGKSTLFRHFNGLLMPKAGEVTVAGISTRKNPARARRAVGMVFQDPDTQMVGETVADDVAFGLENLKQPRHEIDQKVQRILHDLGIAHLADRPPDTLSGGEKRRVAIAGILVMEPEVIVLDEPFSNLDYPAALDLVALLEALHRQGHTLIVATHEVERIIASATRLVILSNGRVAADASPRDLWMLLDQYGVRRPCQCCFESGDLPWAI